MTQEWQPIETAPKDGTVVDLWCERTWHPPERYERVTSCYWTGDSWNLDDSRHVQFPLFQINHQNNPSGNWLVPINWMPLPNPPKQETV